MNLQIQRSHVKIQANRTRSLRHLAKTPWGDTKDPIQKNRPYETAGSFFIRSHTLSPRTSHSLFSYGRRQATSATPPAAFYGRKQLVARVKPGGPGELYRPVDQFGFNEGLCLRSGDPEQVLQEAVEFHGRNMLKHAEHDDNVGLKLLDIAQSFGVDDVKMRFFFLEDLRADHIAADIDKMIGYVDPPITTGIEITDEMLSHPQTAASIIDAGVPREQAEANQTLKGRASGVREVVMLKMFALAVMTEGRMGHALFQQSGGLLHIILVERFSRPFTLPFFKGLFDSLQGSNDLHDILRDQIQKRLWTRRLKRKDNEYIFIALY